jgi:hypothetical protein
MIGRALGGIALACALIAPQIAAADEPPNYPPGGKYHVCNGEMIHVSSLNIRVHCTDGNPMDMSFISWPKTVKFWDGHTAQSASLLPGTPVRVVFTQSLGLRQATEITVYNPQSGAREKTISTTGL